MAVLMVPIKQITKSAIQERFVICLFDCVLRKACEVNIAVLVTMSLSSYTGHPSVPLVPVPLGMNLHHAKMVVVEPSTYLASKRNFF